MTEICLVEGTRCGRYVLVRDREGTLHAVAASAVVALCEHEGTTTMLLPGGRVIVVEVGLPVVLGWLEGGSIALARSSTTSAEVSSRLPISDSLVG